MSWFPAHKCMCEYFWYEDDYTGYRYSPGEEDVIVTDELGGQRIDHPV